MPDTISVHRCPLLIDRPSDLHFSIVVAQPEVRLEQTLGYRLRTETPPQENGWLPAALQITRERNATFAVFPEYSVPWSSWKELDRRLVEELPNNTIVIAGLDSVPQSGFRELLEGGFSLGPADATELSPSQWANCCVVLVKNREGQVSRYLQLKMSEAEEESCAATMARGKSLHVFEAPDFCFALLICYDLMSKLCNGKQLTEWVANEQRLRTIPPLDILFVIQHNPKPEHPPFLNGMQELLRGGRVDAIVAVNTATAGYSALYFAIGQIKVPPAVPPDSYSLEKVEGREVVRARFRTHGQAVFSFDYHPPRQNQSGGVRIPLRDVCEIDPRSSNNGSPRGFPVPPGLWAIREFGSDRHPRLDREEPTRHSSALVQQTFEDYFDRTQSEIRSLDSALLINILRVLFAASGNVNPDPCHWRQQNRDAISVLVRFAAILRFGGPLQFEVHPHKITFELPWANGRKVAVLGGDETLPLSNCASAYISDTELRGGLVCGGCLLVVANHRDLGGARPIPFPVRTASQAQLAGAPQLATLDAARRPHSSQISTGEQPTYGSPEVVLYTYSGRGLETVLASGQTPEEVASALTKVLS
jgi:hypothetical protein